MNTPRIRVLVAEDHPIVADGIAAILASAKDIVVVGQARDGVEAIEMLKRLEPDVVLLDLRMPVLDGIRVAQWIKDTGSNARTVILTICKNENNVAQANQAGAYAYLVKDAAPSEILKTIRHVYRGATRGSPGCSHVKQKANAADLKPLELDLLALIVRGHDNRTIASQLGLGTDEVKYRLRGLFFKLGVRKRAAAARVAIERGLFIGPAEFNERGS